jgi:hypothetical protein
MESTKGRSGEGHINCIKGRFESVSRNSTKGKSGEGYISSIRGSMEAPIETVQREFPEKAS